MDRLLLTVREASELLHIGRSQMYSMIRTGEIPSVTIGRARRIPAHALRSWAGLPEEAPRSAAPPKAADGTRSVDAVAWLESGRLVIDVAKLRRVLSPWP